MFKLMDVSKPVKFALLAIVILVFAASAASALMYGDHYLLGSYEKLDNDDVKYVNSAKILLNKHTLAYNSGEASSAFIMPGMPLVLSGLMLLFGQDGDAVTAFRIVQSALQACSVYLIFAIANRLFGSRAALIAAAASALYLPDYFSAGVILSETIFRTIVMLLILASLAALKSGRTKHYAMAAALVGLACYFKPQAALFPGVLFLLWLAQRTDWRLILKRTAVVAAVLIVMLSPWWVRNYMAFDAFIPFTKSAGSPLLLGALIHDEAPPRPFFDAHPEYEGGKDSLFAGSDDDMAETAKKIMSFGFREQPLTYLKWYTVDKVAGLYAGPFYWKTVFGVSGTGVAIYHIIMMALGAAGIALMLMKPAMRRSAPHRLMLLVLAYFTVIYLPFITFNRYGYPNVFLLFLTAAYALDRMASLVTSKGVSNAQRPSLSKESLV
ncbi:ArnT family glycosyltransferase [Paenibacillus arenilitoris]|uniref:Glycosyltransferase family 39 protein n=1 Tax=Paenibacillus arenilitoris TaxID=2772299 RepID=A0A927CLW3_9BACL|nr:glycosyltransferase family 39 protein [Paenibacillus arenilitoris]MBD2868015.1 glycosyltransferase family 39 protein [Paenibacillus arenilitoris]